MSFFYTDCFVLPLPETHRFPMEKYELLRKNLVETNVVKETELKIPPAATDEEILAVHAAEYLQKLKMGSQSRSEILKMGFPWSVQLIERSRRSSGATIQACKSAYETGFGVNLAGGTHHAFHDRAEGYCLFNDSVIASRVLQHKGDAQNIAIIDTDVHQGNGTAALVQHDPSVFTLSIHGKLNYPIRKEQSDLDIPLEDDASDQDFLDALEQGLSTLFSKFKPDLLIYLAGADPYVDDKLGRLAISKQGLRERNKMVYEIAIRKSLPIAVTMAGGYANIVQDTVDIHYDTIKMGVDMVMG